MTSFSRFSLSPEVLIGKGAGFTPLGLSTQQGRQPSQPQLPENFWYHIPVAMAMGCLVNLEGNSTSFRDH